MTVQIISIFYRFFEWSLSGSFKGLSRARQIDEPQAFDLADRLYITEIDIEVDGGDTFFTVPHPEQWRELERIPAHEGDIQFDFVTLERKSN